MEGKSDKNYVGFYSKETYEAVSAVIHKAEQARHFKALFGRVAGSKTQGISSKGSDNDFLIFVEKTEGNIEQVIEGTIVENIYINDVLVEFDLAYIYWDTVLERVLARKETLFAGYPTNFYRSKEDILKYLPQNMPELMRQRDEYPFVMFHLLLLGNSMWVSDVCMKRNLTELWGLERTIDALDTFFVRAYGNYVYYMKDQERVPLRKYLYTLSQIWAIEWLLDRGTKPPMMFVELMAGMEIEESIRRSTSELIALNREETLHKTKAYTDSRPELNGYIAAMLDRQKERIALYPREETLADVIRRTPLEFRPKLYFEKYKDWKPLE